MFDTAGQLDPEWPPLIACVARVSRLTFEKDTRSGLWPSREEIGCYACQIHLDAETLARAIRSHWGIENQEADSSLEGNTGAFFSMIGVGDLVQQGVEDLVGSSVGMALARS